MATDTSQTKARLDIGKVIQETFGVYKRNIVPFGLAGLVLVGLPLAVSGLIQFSQFNLVQTNPSQAALFALVMIPVAIVSGLASLLMMSSITLSTIGQLDGQNTRLSDTYGRGGAALLGMIGQLILFSFGVGFGFLLLVVPGVMLATAWSVAMQARIVEGPGVFKAFKRSLFLTKGRRWSILLLAIIVYVVMMSLFATQFSLTGGVITGAKNPIRLFLLQPLMSAIVNPFLAVGGAVLYHQLRTLREGVGAQNVAEVFA